MATRCSHRRGPGSTRSPSSCAGIPRRFGNLSVTDVVDHYDTIIRGLERPPIIIGHSFAPAGCSRNSWPIVAWALPPSRWERALPRVSCGSPLSTLRAAWPALGNPANLKKEAPLTLEQFHWCFTNSLSREESDAVYERYYIPGSARPFFQAGFANFNPKAVTKVDYRNPARPPLLLVTGAEDRICPPSVNKANFKKQSHAPSATEHREYPGRCHFPGQDGWEEVAPDYVLSWAARPLEPGGREHSMTHLRITHIGGPTVLIQFDGWRLLTDPTFDPPGREYKFGWGTGSVKLAGPAIAPSDLLPIHAVLLTHEHHDDNLDAAGRALLPSADTVVTTVSGSQRLDGDVRGLEPWAATALEAPGRTPIEVTATPCRHGPPLSRPITGDVIGFALRWDGQENGALWISGDTVLYEGVRKVADRVQVGTALLHLGGVQFPVTGARSTTR